MRYLTERDRLIAEAERARHKAHAEGDFEAYAKSVAARKEAEELTGVHECPCGKEWDGKGRLTICYVSMYEDTESGIVWLEEHSRGDEHHLYWCPECAPKIKAHLNKR